MPCHSSMIEHLITVKADQEVGEAIEVLRKNEIDAVPVVNDEGGLEGIFSTQILLKNLLPVEFTTGDGLHMDIKVGAAPGVAKRLRKVKPLKVSDLMDRKVNAVTPETPLWEGVNMLVHKGAPVLVVEREGGKLLGMIVEQSIIDEMERVQDEPET
ncbi:MAG: hypothetical protein DHS20C02_04580 [Micavibrio sp.]|nr:MAG: hypothetical protein DHS20C02_04580 [Micavibrio sp.]